MTALLQELNIENLAVIPAARMELSPGLNIISGETGAGKTILAMAINLLMGGRADSHLIRPGAAEASVEAIFTLPSGFLAGEAEDICAPEDGILIVRRRISRGGRGRAYVGGHAVSLSVLERLTGRCLRLSAQHEQQRLMMASHQLEIVDAFGGARLIGLRDEYRLAFERRAELAASLEAASRDSEAAAREAELIGFQLAEIEAAAPRPGEDAELDAERRRLLKTRELKEAAEGMASLLGGEGSVMDHLAAAGERLAAVAGVDPVLDGIAAQFQAAFYELEEAGRGARDHGESLELDPARLAEVEERLELLGGLKRKYGGSLSAVMEYAQTAGGRLALIGAAAQDRSGLEAELSAAEDEAVRLAARLRQLRLKAAAGLQAEVTAQLKELAFRHCEFEVRLAGPAGEPRAGKEPEKGDAAGEKAAREDSPPGAPGPEGIAAVDLTASGADSVEFFAGLNPGMPALPLKDTASGGEMSRIMLAIKNAAPAEEAVTMVFDEIDAGIGGATGAAVGARLKSLARGSQIICITHLPQIACFADAHFSVAKAASGGTTVTSVNRLQEDEIVGELCRMMGSEPEDGKARAHAASLLSRAETGRATKEKKV